MTMISTTGCNEDKGGRFKRSVAESAVFKGQEFGRWLKESMERVMTMDALETSVSTTDTGRTRATIEPVMALFIGHDRERWWLLGVYRSAVGVPSPSLYGWRQSVINR